VVLILRQQRLYSKASNVWSIATQQANTDVHNGIPTAKMVLPLGTETLHKSSKFEFAIVTSALNWTSSPEEKTVSHVSRKIHMKIRQKPRAESYIVHNRKTNKPKRKYD
jgi:hypothetical protein